MTYHAAMQECATAHRQQRDLVGANAISAMLSSPQSAHRRFAAYQPEPLREICLNAIAFAEQESK